MFPCRIPDPRRLPAAVATLLLGPALAVLAATEPGSGTTQRPPTDRAPLTALDRYVHQPDPAYTWKLAASVKGDGGTAHVLQMTSQSWLTTNEVNRTEWRHWLVVIRPDQVEHTTGLLFIGGGNNRDDRPPKVNGDLVRVARQTRSVVAELRMVPNQPLIFGGDGVERVEDDLIAYAWDKFLRTGEARWAPRMAMTKAAVRAMDTITAFCASEAGGGATVESFVVAGGSKRGWTTWTTGIVDRRVKAICPIVIDVLNMSASMRHHFQAYGFYAPAVGDYVRHGIMNWFGTPEMTALQALVDPYSYRDRLTLPKLMLNACGDQFFLPDSSQFYFSGLSGPKYLRYVPNADHSLKGSDAMETLLAWQDAIAAGRALPVFEWSHGNLGALTVRAKDRPLTVKLWQASNPKARDFRLETLGPVWQATDLAARDGAYEARVETPAQGWTAYMVELAFDIGAPAPLKLTTDVRVIPETLPFPPPEPATTALGR